MDQRGRWESLDLQESQENLVSAASQESQVKWATEDQRACQGERAETGRMERMDRMASKAVLAHLGHRVLWATEGNQGHLVRRETRA